MITDTPFTALERRAQKRKLRSAFSKLEQHICAGHSINTEIELGIVEKMYDAKLNAVHEEERRTKEKTR